jgi:putative FmdB family regulatory protein
MPIYEYQCKKCGKTFEVFQGISDSDVTQCNACKGPVEKLISLSSFHLKGSGWYVTDYAGKKPSASDGSSNESQAAHSTASDSKKDTPSTGTDTANAKTKE